VGVKGGSEQSLGVEVGSKEVGGEEFGTLFVEYLGMLGLKVREAMVTFNM
jgi:hypothetical protein